MIRTITINGVAYTLKYTLRSLFFFEEIAGRSFDIKKLADWILWFYSTLFVNNQTFRMELNDFVSLCDEHTELFTEFKQFVESWAKLEAQKTTPQSSPNEVKKKTSRKTKG